MHDPRLLRLHADDNVLVAARTLDAGERLVLGATVVSTAVRIALGHKIAATAIAQGAKVIKYGVPIGSATCAIRAGDHVHVHNLRSDYLPTYTREASRIDESSPK